MIQPDSVHIGLYRYQVSVDNEGLERESLYGKIRYQEQRIYVRDDMPQERQAANLLHEVMHGVLEHAGLQCGKKIEEFITVSAPGLVDVLRTNPELVGFLLGSDYAIHRHEVSP